ncbi:MULTISPECIES: acyltransferase family protein [Stutzerimonas stutzeri subgroup]|nr:MULTISPECIES: acyltransferase [Stutzerimonas stutzeri subgroup]MCQ2037470.1 acyltransferase [Stutzerimonas kunmingensis]
MTQPRSILVSLDDTSWYHCVCRCVRRAFLCGDDRLSGQNYDHRRGWIAERMKELAQVFAIDIAAYAVMSNHYHLVAHVDRARALSWSTDDVLARWTRLFSGPPLVVRYLSPERAALGAAELARIAEYAECYRARLHDLSWFMRVLNESVARQANAEDECTGRFWEGRFKSQALLDEQALLAAMAYVDLNPIRAGIAETPEDSDYTSIQERLADARTATAPTSFTAAPFDIPPQALSLIVHLSLMFWGALVRHAHEHDTLPRLAMLVMIGFGAGWITVGLLVGAQHMLVRPNEALFRTFVPCAAGVAMFVSFATYMKLRARALVWLGAVSYSLYLFHPVAQYSLSWLVQATDIAVLKGWSTGSYMLATASLTIGISALTYRYVEVPFQALGGRIAKNVVEAENRQLA